MPIIACKLGATSQVVGGLTYRFNFDPAYAAHVAEVHDLAHAACFLSIAHYQEAVRRKPNGEEKQEAVSGTRTGDVNQEAVRHEVANGDTRNMAVRASAKTEQGLGQSSSKGGRKKKDTPVGEMDIALELGDGMSLDKGEGDS